MKRQPLISLRWPIYVFNSVDSTKLPCYTLPPTQHHSFFRNLPPSIDVEQLSTRETSIFEVLHLRSCFFLFNFNRPSKTRFKKRVCMQGILSARFTLTGILSLLWSTQKSYSSTKSLSYTPVTCNLYNCKDQGIESGNCSDISGWRPFRRHNNALASLIDFS